MSSIECMTTSDDGTHQRAENFVEAFNLIYEASGHFGKSFTSAPTWRAKIVKAGFVDVHEMVFKVRETDRQTHTQRESGVRSWTFYQLTTAQLPQSPWSNDPKLKEIGRYHQVNVLEAVAPYTMALFCRILGWSRIQVEALLAAIRNEIKDMSIHLYTNVRVVYAQKPNH